MRPLLIPDLDRLRHKLADPPPLLAGLYRRFRERLDADPDFRRHNIFLPALLGEPEAVSEARTAILELAADPVLLAGGRQSAGGARNRLDHHIWCVAPRAMRLAAYFTWLDVHDAWSDNERHAVAAHVIDFFYRYVIPVLRARIPGGHNQQLSMTLCAAMTAHVFANVHSVGERATALEAYAQPKLRQALGLMPRSGYSGEGSTYQSDVVSGLVMWTGIFLEQLGETDIWTKEWAPCGSSLADTLLMESRLGSCGVLLPPWDHYGWTRTHNLAARTLWAGLTGRNLLLQTAEPVWDRNGELAWRPDDRLWTIIYWPEDEGGQESAGHSSHLSGWSVPNVGAAIEHLPTRLRVMTVWDRSSAGLQGIGRNQANPNHLMIELAGEPITADGSDGGSRLLFTEASNDRTINGLTDVERELTAQQYGSLDTWVRHCQEGFLGSSCAIVVDDWDSYFPRAGWEGKLLFEERALDRHTFAADAAAFYRPAFDVTLMRRTVSVGASGIVWVVDDIGARSPHRFTWRGWFRRTIVVDGPLRLRLTLLSGAEITIASSVQSDQSGPPATIATHDAPTFPWGRQGMAWPDQGSVRCDLAVAGCNVQFVTCITPHAATDLQVHQAGPGAFDAVWRDGSETFEVPPVGTTDESTPSLPLEPETVCDIDEPPFALADAPDAVLLTALDTAPLDSWRQTTLAMQTLTARGCQDAMPRIVALLQDPRQNYTVHSVAAWCLGYTRYRPAIEVLRKIAHIPEVNTATRCGWAVDRMQTDDPPPAP